MQLDTLEDLRFKVLKSHTHYQKNKDSGVLIDGKTGHIKISLKMCCDILNIKPDKITALAAIKTNGKSTATRLIKKGLIKKGVKEQALDSWTECGLNFSDFMALMECFEEKGHTNATKVCKIYRELGHDEFLKAMLEPVVSAEALALIPKPVNQSLAESLVLEQRKLEACNLDALRSRFLVLNKKYEDKGKFVWQVDEETKQVKLRLRLCWELFRLDPNVFFGYKLKDMANITHLIGLGISEETMKKWHSTGISINELLIVIKYLANNDKYKGNTLELLEEIQNVGYYALLKKVFKGVIPSNLFAKAKSEPKRLKPAYDITPNDLKELAISRYLAVTLSALREYPTPSGNIDLLTASQLIEVKSGDNWKHGIGQLIAYGTHHPNKQLILYLFDYDNLDLENVRMVCNRVNIELMLHN